MYRFLIRFVFFCCCCTENFPAVGLIKVSESESEKKPINAHYLWETFVHTINVFQLYQNMYIRATYTQQFIEHVCDFVL